MDLLDVETTYTLQFNEEEIYSLEYILRQFLELQVLEGEKTKKTESYIRKKEFAEKLLFILE